MKQLPVRIPDDMKAKILLVSKMKGEKMAESVRRWIRDGMKKDLKEINE